MLRKLFSSSAPYVLGIAVWMSVSSAAQADCNTLRQQAAVYQDYVNRYCGDPRLASVCAQMRSYISQVTRMCPNNPPTRPPTTTPPNNDYERMLQQVEANRRAALNWVASNRPGRNGGYFVQYRKPPIYQGQPWDSRVYTYHFKAYEATRVINMLANNRNLLIRIGQW